MSVQYSYSDEMYEFAKQEYDTEIMLKQLYKEKANFAHLKNLRSMQKLLTILDDS